MLSALAGCRNTPWLTLTEDSMKLEAFLLCVLPRETKWERREQALNTARKRNFL